MTEQERLAGWHKVVFNHNLDILDDLLADDITFHTPLYLKPRQGREAAKFILTSVTEIFENFTYHREMLVGDIWMLEFSANIGQFSLKGIDVIEWNAAGQIIDFEVYIRPINAVQALGAAMYEKIKAAGMTELM